MFGLGRSYKAVCHAQGGMEMKREPYYKTHWRDIESSRMSAYRTGFAWDAATDAYYESAEIALGHTVADFGCGPGKIAVALAQMRRFC